MANPDVLKLVLDVCSKKIQAQREAEEVGNPLVAKALNSTVLEQHLLSKLKQEAKATALHASPLILRYPNYAQAAASPHAGPATRLKRGFAHADT